MRALLSPVLAVLLFHWVPTARAAELRLDPGTAKPGDPVLVTVTGVAGVPVGELAGRPLQFYPVPGGFQSLTGLPVELPPGELAVRIEAPVAEAVKPGPKVLQLEENGEVVSPTAANHPLVLEGTLTVVDPRYRVRELTVASKFVSPPAKVKKWMKEDRAAFTQAQSQPFGPPLFKADFSWPTASEQTAPFGDLRTFNGKKQSQHYGVDLDGRIGDPVQAANDGTVVLVRECYASGNTVIVHHGAGLYTLYFHLSAFEVKQGQRVRQGQTLGQVGRTGRVTGPHLHWSVKADSFYVDGETLVKLPFSRWLSR